MTVDSDEGEKSKFDFSSSSLFNNGQNIYKTIDSILRLIYFIINITSSSIDYNAVNRF